MVFEKKWIYSLEPNSSYIQYYLIAHHNSEQLKNESQLKHFKPYCIAIACKQNTQTSDYVNLDTREHKGGFKVRAIRFHKHS